MSACTRVCMSRFARHTAAATHRRRVRADTVFRALHSEAWVKETRAMLDPELDRHFALRDQGAFWQGGPDSGRVAIAPAFQAFEWSPFGHRLMEHIACHPTILDFAEMVMGPFVQLDSCEVTGYEGSDSDNDHATGWHRDGFDTSGTWNNNHQNIDNGLEWRPGTSSLAERAAPKVPATRRPYTPPLACNYLTYLQPTDGTDNNPGLRVVPGSHRDYSSAITAQPRGTDDRDSPPGAGERSLDHDPRVICSSSGIISFRLRIKCAVCPSWCGLYSAERSRNPLLLCAFAAACRR